jgi:hypothetical protein
MFKPSLPYSCPIELLIPTYTTSKGVTYKTWGEGIRLNCSFKSYGGTESVKTLEGKSDGVLVVFDTALVETWYRPDIKAECAIRLCETGEVYEIMGHPEDIDKRHQFVRFKVRAIQGNG